ncbi:MAG: molybdopterin-dependent oxidoreductase [Deltaproteobacteria bacterium]|nr:molybdopterin-dependent oxidoreductase [Deltaproteobacteria bacterium]
MRGSGARTCVDIAKEFTSHGKKAVADLHRGVSQHTAGFYNVTAWYTVNALVGNIGWQGGLWKATTWNYTGNRPGKPFDVSKQYAGGIKAWGVNIIRHSAVYDKSTLFKGFPAKTNLVSLLHGYLPGGHSRALAIKYPYPIKALLLYMGSPVYALPSGHTLIEILRDTRKLPLFIASDIVVGETSTYADDIFPDTTYLGAPGVSWAHPSVAPKVFPIRQPAAAPLVGNVTVFGQEMPMNMEAMILAVRRKTGLARIRRQCLRAGQAHAPRRGYLPAHGGQRGFRRQGRRFRTGPSRRWRRDPHLRGSRVGTCPSRFLMRNAGKRWWAMKCGPTWSMC